MRVLVLAVVAASALFAHSSSAAAAVDFVPCQGTADFECARLPVPLDPSDRDGATIVLEVRRLVETRNERGVLLALAGGPGQASTSFIDDFGDVLAEALEDRQLIVVDQRGTGLSGPLSCPALGGLGAGTTLGSLRRLVGRCASELGERRRFFTTTEVVADLEVLRAALETEQMSLFGISYGSYVAQRYARLHPDRVSGLVLDSPVAQDQGGPFDQSSYGSLGRALRAVCAGGRCPRADPSADLRRVAANLRQRPLAGTVVDRRGRARRARITGEAQLFDLLVASDFSDPLRASIPGALRSALRGDAAPLLRLVVADEETADPRQLDEENEDPAQFSNALFFATTCQEKPLPWDPASRPGERERARRAAIGALSPGAFGPFGAAAADSTQLGSAFCLDWPEGRVAKPPPPGPIRAPTVILSGETDLRTPLAEARRTAALMTNVSLVRVPGAGHALVSRRLECVQRALRRFFTNTAVGNPCAGRDAATAERPAPVAPRRLTSVPLRGIRGAGRRLAAVAVATVEDALRTVSIQGGVEGPVGLGGLRGGSVCARPGEVAPTGRRPLLLDLHAAEYAPGVRLTGIAVVEAGRLATLRVTVDGAALGRGSIVLDRRRLRGRVGGRRVRAEIARSRLRTPSLEVPTALVNGERGSCR